MGIVTDSTPLEEPKNPETDNVFKLYRLLANSEQTETMRQNYIKGGFGYGHAKTALYELILDKYSAQRKLFNELMQDSAKLESELKIGEEKAKKIATEKLKLVRATAGY